MFKKHKLGNLLLLLLVSIILPLNVFAYSDYIIAGGTNIGIQINSNGILVVGTYKIGELDPANDADLKIGDKITHINNTLVTSIDEMLNVLSEIDNPNSINITFF